MPPPGGGTIGDAAAAAAATTLLRVVVVIKPRPRWLPRRGGDRSSDCTVVSTRKQATELGAPIGRRGLGDVVAGPNMASDGALEIVVSFAIVAALL